MRTVYQRARFVASVAQISLIFPLLPGITFTGDFFAAVGLGLIYWVVVYELCYEVPERVHPSDHFFAGIFGFLIFPVLAIIILGSIFDCFAVTSWGSGIAAAVISIIMQYVIEYVVIRAARYS